MYCWVFKINTKLGWKFDNYFLSRERGHYEMGDEGWIRSASSLRYLLLFSVNNCWSEFSFNRSESI